MSKITEFSSGFTIEALGRTWKSAPWDCKILLADEKEVLFSQAKSETKPFSTGVGTGFKTVYSDFPGIPGLKLQCSAWAEEATGDVIFEMVPLSDASVKDILWPAPFANEAKEAMTVLPVMQGALIPNYTQEELPWVWPVESDWPEHGRYSCSRSMYMQFFGQYDNDGGVMTIFETRFDGGMQPECGGGKTVVIGARWRESLGKVGYTRRLRVKFFPAGSNYNEMAMAYRDHVKAIGELVTLEQKAAVNPRVRELIGRPIVHTYIWYHTQPDSHGYKKDQPEKNDRKQTFAFVGEGLKKLKAMGQERALLHLDGWGRRGYDNQHPDYLPPAEELGGWDGMKQLQDTCHELGYFFGIHDQFRDYFYDAPTFNEEYAIHNEDMSVPQHAYWMGGHQTYLCASQAPYYIRRNYDGLYEHGIMPDNAYLDVFSCVELDECFHPDHKMTREECARYRLRGFREAARRGTIIQSEEGIDWAFPALAFLHHAPHAPSVNWDRGPAVGIPVPLLDLVYHDCIVVPWSDFALGDDKAGTLFCLLSGGGAYLPLDATDQQMAHTKLLTDWQEKVQMRQMLRHEMLDGNPKRQKTWFEGGYAAEVNFETGEYILTEPEA